MDCKTINLFPQNKADGHCCVKCKGYLVPIGNAVIGVDLGGDKDFTAYPRSNKNAF